MIEKLTIEIKGVQPFIMNNGQQIDPQNRYSKLKKPLTSKRAKTEEDQAAIFDIEHRATAYWDDKHGLYLPAECVQACFLAACKKRKLGRQSIAFLPDVSADLSGFEIKSPNHKNADKFFADPETRFVKNVNVSGRSVMKCRCIVPAGWECTINANLDSEKLDVRDVEDIWNIAGSEVGFGDWRPSAPKKPGWYGIFDVTNFSVNGG